MRAVVTKLARGTSKISLSSLVARRLISAMVLLAFAGCTSSRVARNWRRLEVGMPQDMVVRMLGTSDCIANHSQIRDEGVPSGTNSTVATVLRTSSSMYLIMIHNTKERWTYNLESNLLGRVYFDHAGKILSFTCYRPN
jgi:hypothetical protein